MCKALISGRGSLARRSGQDGYVTGEFLSTYVFELELELIQTHMTQKQVLRVEVGARALRVLIKNAVGQEG